MVIYKVIILPENSFWSWPIAQGKVLFSTEKYFHFSYFSTKTYNVLVLIRSALFWYLELSHF